MASVLWILVAAGLAAGIRLVWHTTLGGRLSEPLSLSLVGQWIFTFLFQLLINLIINLILTVIINIVVNLFLEIITLGNADPVFVGGGGLTGGGGASGVW